MPGSLRSKTRRIKSVPLLLAVFLPVASLSATTYEENVVFIGHAANEDTGSPRGLLVRRDDGDSFLLTVGDGCGRLAEGRTVSLREELQDGERLAYVEDPGGNAACDVIDSRAVKVVNDEPAPQSTLAQSDELERVVRALQGALGILGYEPGPVDGEVGPETAAALMQYRTDKHHDRGGLDLRFTIWTLGMDILVLRPRDEGAFAIADTLFRTSEN